MKIKSIVIIIGLIFFLEHVLMAQNMLIDSIGNSKVEYNDLNKPILVYYKDNYYEHGGIVTVYRKLIYNNENFLTKIIGYVIDINGDTLVKPVTTATFEYENNKLSKITDNMVYYDDIVWENDDILEFKYYYHNNNEIDSSKTRIIKNTYVDHNIKTSVYKELTGLTFHNEEFQYDDKINPYYKSELALLSGNLIFYSSKNNWISSVHLDNNSPNWSRTITYNSYNYPVKIVTDYNNGNIGTFKFKYIFSTLISNIKTSPSFKIFPNPVQENFNIETDEATEFESIYLINMNGQVLKVFNEKKHLDIREFAPGIYLLIINNNGNLQTSKIIKSPGNF